MNEAILICMWAGVIIHWLYRHFRFKRILKKSDPSLFAAHSSKSFLKHTSGRAYVDLVLDNGHLGSNCSNVVKYGNKLKSSYEHLALRVIILLAIALVWGRITPFV